MESRGDGPLYSSYENDPLLGDLIEIFVDEMGDRVTLLLAAFDTDNIELVRRYAHQLKGACGSYGFDALTEPARRLEQCTSGDEIDRSAIKRELDRLVADCRRLAISTRVRS